MDQNIQDTQLSQIKQNNLMLNTEPFEEYNDIFMNQSLSEGFFSYDMNKKYQQQSPQRSSSSNDEDIIDLPQLSIPADTQRELIFSFQTSPNIVGLGQPRLINYRRGIYEKRPRHSASSPAKSDIIHSGRNIYQNLIQYFYLKTFIRKLSNRKNMSSLFSQYHFNVINDKGSVFNMKLFKEKALRLKSLKTVLQPKQLLIRQIVMKPISIWMVQILTKTNQIIERIPIIYPESMIKLIWDGFAQLARVYFIFMIPLDLSFNQQQFMFGIQYTATVFMLMVLLLDYLVNFNTAHYQQGQIVINRLQIIKHVVAKSGGLEIMSVGLLFLSWSFKELQSGYTIDATIQLYQLGLMIFFIQYRNLSKFIKQVEESLNLSKPPKAILELFKLIIGIMVVLHVFACLWYWAGYYSHITYGKSWLDQKGIVDVSWQEDYLYSFYFSTVTMFTVGYGDISPQSDLETIISIFFMMITSIQLSYSVSTVGAIIDKISAYEEEKSKKLQTINTFMSTKKIGVREYLNYFWQAQNEVDSSQEKEIIGQLSEHLRERLMLEANSLILNNCVLFHNHFSPELKIQLVKCIKQVVVQPENVIDFDNLFPDNEKNQIYICFIEKGSVEIHIEKETNLMNKRNINDEVSIVSQLSQGQSLGVVSFLTGEKSPESYRSMGFTKLLLLSRDDFLKIIPEFPEDFEQYKNFQDKLKLYQNFQFLNMTCFSCKSTDHKALDCPLMHFIPDKEFIIKQEQFSRNQERNEQTQMQKSFKRRGRKDVVNARFDQEFISDSAVAFQNEHWQETLFFDCDEEDQNFPIQFAQQIQDLQDLENKQDEQTNKKKTSLIRQKTKNFSINNIEDQFNETAPFSDYDIMKKSSMKKTNKAVQFKSKELTPIIMKSISPLPIISSTKEEDEVMENGFHQMMLPSIFHLQPKKFGQDKPQKSVNNKNQGQSSSLSLKKRFQKAVQIIKSLNSINRLKQFSRFRSSQELSSTIEQERKKLIIFQKNQLQNLILRRQCMIKNQNITNTSEAFQRDSQIAEFTMLKLQMLTESKVPLSDFELTKTFKFYFPNNNIDQVLFKYETYYRPNQQKTEQLPQLYSQLVQYLLYPYDYIEKFIFTSSNKKQVPLTGMRIPFLKTIITPQKRTLRKKSVQNSRKNQIRPMSDGAILTQKSKRF